MRRCVSVFLLLFALVKCPWAFQGPGIPGMKDYLKNLPFEMPPISEPRFPDRPFSIAGCGAVADGRTMNTAAFEKAISECTKAGGGSVVVPPGTWLTGPIRLASNVNLHLEHGALIQFSNHCEDFRVVADSGGESRDFNFLPLISGSGLNNIAITGEGIIDGAGEAWRAVKKEKLTSRQWKDLIASGGCVAPDGKTWWSSKEAMEGGVYHNNPPDLLRLEDCRGILLDGPTFENSPNSHLHPVKCEEVIIRHVFIRSGSNAQNGGGMDLGSCRNVLVHEATVDCGGDGICISAGNIPGSQASGPACDRIVIADCAVYHAHGGFVVGNETSGGATHIIVRNCVFLGTNVGIRFTSQRTKGGIVENITIDGISMRNIANEAILFDSFDGGDSPEVKAPKGQGGRHGESLTGRTPEFRNISIKNVVCNGADRALRITGLPEMPVKFIQFENVSLTARHGILCTDAERIDLTNCTITPSNGTVITLSQAMYINLMKIAYPKGADVFLSVTGEKSEAIRVSSINLQLARKGIVIGGGANEHAVVVNE